MEEKIAELEKKLSDLQEKYDDLLERFEKVESFYDYYFEGLFTILQKNGFA